MTPNRPNRRTLLAGLTAALFGWVFASKVTATAAKATIDKVPLPLDSNLRTQTFSASSLPPGLRIDSATGCISGVITFPADGQSGTIELR